MYIDYTFKDEAIIDKKKSNTFHPLINYISRIVKHIDQSIAYSLYRRCRYRNISVALDGISFQILFHITF